MTVALKGAVTDEWFGSDIEMFIEQVIESAKRSVWHEKGHMA